MALRWAQRGRWPCCRNTSLSVTSRPAASTSRFKQPRQTQCLVFSQSGRHYATHAYDPILGSQSPRGEYKQATEESFSSFVNRQLPEVRFNESQSAWKAVTVLSHAPQDVSNGQCGKRYHERPGLIHNTETLRSDITPAIVSRGEGSGETPLHHLCH